ncbi:alpha/beta fold hydrolase [uncultured Winogradskyella sp.]|uniref:alpha/beta hydrolase n=1 Tax=uncultured Winogradskyella sp. TaxID=395353 RepID=UPI002629D9AD|nr:alpha/beta fold hydrolase [uncultured Winogradskyella sp.]
MLKKRKIEIIKITLVALTIIGFVIIHFILPRIIVQKRNTIKISSTESYLKYDSIINDSSQFKREKLSFKSFDGLNLSALLTRATIDSIKGTLILVPNSSSNKYTLLDFSEFLAKRGYNSVAVDLRGYGESEGKFCTYGVKEKKDIQSLIDRLHQYENIEPIGIWGNSLGAAVAIQAMGIEKRIKFGIVESTFTDYKTSMDTYFTRLTKVKLKPLTNYIVDRSGSIGDFDVDDASPIKYAENVTQPIIIAHGEKDKVFEVKYGKENFDKIKSINKKFIVIDSAPHTYLWEVGGEEYFEKVMLFLDMQEIQ